MFDSAAGVSTRLKDAIQTALPDCAVEVMAGSPGHFSVRVVAEAFRGLPRVRQHQIVYTAMAPLLTGEAPPVHAIDRLETATP